MKHIKNYKIFEDIEFVNYPSSEQEVRKICEKYTILNYSINDDMSIDVEGTVRFLPNKKIKKLPIKFGKVSGDFSCADNYLITLEGFPKYVGGYIDINLNNLKSLKGLPDVIENGLYCKFNFIEDFNDSPKEVKGFLDIRSNKIKTLENIPDIEGNFLVAHNPIYFLIYKIIEKNNREELLKEFEEYSIVRSDKVVMNRLKAFYNDFDLGGINDSAMDLIKKNYTIA